MQSRCFIEWFVLKVIDCRICGDPHSVLRFAFVEFADECKSSTVNLSSLNSPYGK